MIAHGDFNYVINNYQSPQAYLFCCASVSILLFIDPEPARPELKHTATRYVRKIKVWYAKLELTAL